jgi:hypothetical protein
MYYKKGKYLTYGELQNHSLRLNGNIPHYVGLVSNKCYKFHEVSLDLLERNNS